MSERENELSNDGTITWGELLRETSHALLRSHIDNAEVEARWLVETATGSGRGEFDEMRTSLASVRGVAHLDSMVRRRVVGEPIQYVLGSWAFRSLDLMIDQRVLIPRPETEIVAGLAIAELGRLRPGGGGTVVDLGTGSGAIGLSVVAECSTARVLLTDQSSDALSVARANLAGLGTLGRSVEISEGSWYDAVPTRYEGECDVIVSNPPYVRSNDDLPASVTQWEPRHALVAGVDGLDDLRIIVAGASRWLRAAGAVVLEMDPRQTKDVSELLSFEGFETTIHRDFAGVERAIVARMS